MESSRIKIYDCTLREGAQASGISFSVQDKLRFTELVDDMGFAYVEGGWPGSNVTDGRYFEQLKSLRLRQIKVVAFGRTKFAHLKVEDDVSLGALIRTDVACGHIFGKGWDLHVEEVLRVSPEQNRESIYESVRFLKKHMEEVSFGFEHFFDAFKANPESALKIVQAVVDGGADWIDLADTNGSSFPEEISAAVALLKQRFPIEFAVHCHNDTGCAVANTLAAVRSGATIVEGTVNGYSERCGMADLCTVIPNLQLKLGYQCIPDEKMKMLTHLSREVADLLQADPLKFHPYVGSYAFTHKGGIHVDSFLKNPRTYEHIDPRLVGNRSEVLLSEVCGKSNLKYFLQHHRLEHLFSEADVTQLVTLVKELESSGFEFDSVEESFVLFLLRRSGTFTPKIQIKRHSTTISDELSPWYQASRLKHSEAPIAAQTGAMEFEAVLDYLTPRGPIQGQALRLSFKGEQASLANLVESLVESCVRVFPELAGISLVNYKVRAVNDDPQPSLIRVVIELDQHGKHWRMAGVARNLSSAIVLAVIDALEYRLLTRGEVSASPDEKAR